MSKLHSDHSESERAAGLIFINACGIGWDHTDTSQVST